VAVRASAEARERERQSDLMRLRSSRARHRANLQPWAMLDPRDAPEIGPRRIPGSRAQGVPFVRHCVELRPVTDRPPIVMRLSMAPSPISAERERDPIEARSGPFSWSALGGIRTPGRLMRVVLHDTCNGPVPPPQAEPHLAGALRIHPTTPCDIDASPG
jgi:hypothetical protein